MKNAILITIVVLIYYLSGFFTRKFLPVKQSETSTKIMAITGTLKTCKEGHQFYKSSDCPTCPVCEEDRKPKNSFLTLIGAPARRALGFEPCITACLEHLN